MPIGGGTFQSYDKIIPGIYANFESVNIEELNPQTGTVAFLIPVLNTKEEFPTVTLVTASTYKTLAVQFASTNCISAENLIQYSTEIFCNATQIYWIPIKTKYEIACTQCAKAWHTQSIKPIKKNT